MKKITYSIILLLSIQYAIGQKAQTFAYIDTDYILENVPEYKKAQDLINVKAEEWKANLNKQSRFIEVLKSDLVTEKAILTKDIISDKEQEITIKQEELSRLEALYFGPDGELFELRKQLVNPIQDLIYNAVQDISKKRKYDFVFDKSSDLVMLYFNKKYDISELVLATIIKSKKIAEVAEKTNAKKLEMEANKEAIKKARQELIDKQNKIIQAKKEARLKEIEDKKKKLLEKKNSVIKEKEVEKTKRNNQN
ncbi:membrane protein [Polaribacter pacificus]|uniref:Membrane protein n=1 Tax=Polaribacter pacificus TaxID=1775173 RepID=A0A917HWK9_9FLAO|nr:OmpH family outer membrane protein [Polaribacter pacificus]GGG90961.1 membrane protein [Polaribacter pacificus]